MLERGVSYPDGTPVALAMKLLGGSKTSHRVRGPSFFEAALARSERTGHRHFFLGTTESTLLSLEHSIARRWPGVQVAGTFAPPFEAATDEVLDDWAARIRRTHADCVWIALGTPKQDLVAERLAQRLGIPCLAVGAAVDFVAGTKREAPGWMQRLGFEWLFRLVTEPHRLWRRYLIGNVKFVVLVLKYGRGAARATGTAQGAQPLHASAPAASRMFDQKA